jgi:hypothetical protein
MLTTPLTAPLCPVCGQPNECAASATGSFDTPCWCAGVTFPADLLAQVPQPLQNKACICRRCVAQHHARDSGQGLA